MERRIALFFMGIALFQLLVGVSSQWPATLTPDAAMHAEIVEIVRQQPVPRTWEPYAKTSFTYPPLFHWLAAMLPLEAIDAVRALGLAVWLLFPVAVYSLVATYSRRVAPVAAALISLVPSFSTIFIYGEFPQLLAMLLLVLQWAFLRRGKLLAAGVFAGLVVLSHPFVALAAAALQAFFVAQKVQVRKGVSAQAQHRGNDAGRSALLSLFVIPLVASPWIPAYVAIAGNALAGDWENVSYNAVQPVFGFWGFGQIAGFLFGVHGLTVLVVLLALAGFFTTKDVLLRGFFAVCAAFTVFHLPFTQLKVLDLLALPAVALAAIGLVRLGGKRWKLAAGIAIVALLAVQVEHFGRARADWFNHEIAPGAELIDAAEWLGEFDQRRVRIYAHEASVWAGVLAGKLPLDPGVSFIEAFSGDYKEQLAMNSEIKKVVNEGKDVHNLLEKYGVEYALVPRNKQTDAELLYQNSGWAVYRG